ncbi:MAG: type II secretion system protein GspG [Phycisphaerae bacterium]|nr:type II secretion system protein GspG [Phycisphaerae bacterium]
MTEAEAPRWLLALRGSVRSLIVGVIAVLIGVCVLLTAGRTLLRMGSGPGIDMRWNAVGPTGPFATALSLYRTHMGDYPRELRALLVAPREPELAEKWAGPYLEKGTMLLDPWGTPYGYRFPGKFNRDAYDLWSAGPDGRDGTEDDIVNWRTERD